jgi:hypothetical protein
MSLFSSESSDLDVLLFVREEVRRSMVEAQCSVQITFPVELKGPNVVSCFYKRKDVSCRRSERCFNFDAIEQHC